ncbi:MAG: hypothetical protein HYT21_01360 [Candidatus Nealsonbacteria bacterium]|nr:hypothetical protein [Candidatus Nealsonbacteria bacterium]
MKRDRPQLFEMAKEMAQRCRRIADESPKFQGPVSEEFLKKKEKDFSNYVRELGEFFGFCRGMFAAGIFTAGDLVELNKYVFEEKPAVPPEIISFINGLKVIDELPPAIKGDS